MKLRLFSRWIIGQPLPYPMTKLELARYKAWKRHVRRIAFLDRWHSKLRAISANAYYRAVERINRNG